MNNLERALQQYRVLHTPTQYSVYQFWANQVFSHDDLLECSREEQEQFYDRIEVGAITFCKSIRDKEGEIGTLHSLLNIITDSRYKDIKKVERKVVYSASDGLRPIGYHAFDQWSGFQVIDMDIKDREFATYLKTNIFARLVKYNWFVGVAYSSSGKGLHIYTKIRVPDSDDSQKKKLLYLTNFRHKYSFVYLACLKVIGGMMNADGTPVTKDQLAQWLDFAMFKPQQGAFIGYDEHPLFNTHFFEDFIYVNFDNVEDMGHPDVDWVTYPDLREAFKRWEWFEEDDKPADIDIKDAPLLETTTSNKVHYKHNERWKLANTLVRLYGKDQGFEYLRLICSADIPTKELKSDCVTAARHEKPIEPWAVNQLNKWHGFNIKVSIDKEEKDLSEIMTSVDMLDNPTMMHSSPHTKTFNINENQYLSDIKEELIASCGMITLIEAGAGVGKTEMVKSLVNDGYRVLLVMPFTSTIKSKVEHDPQWCYAYGNQKPVLESQHGLAITIDKFSRLNMMELKEAGFDYIFIDESHLMFQSEYRPVMSKVIKSIKNTEISIILMSGTPVGETVFFDDIVHLRVIKKDVRKKQLNTFLTDKPIDNMCHMCRAIAKDISEDRRVLFPTNKGTTFKKQVETLVTYFLQEEFKVYREPVVRYYKKSNLGDLFMDKINFEKTVDNTDVLMCSTYLSVGVDILDRFDFNIYFDELWMPQEVEQFANRLRSHDLFINIFLNRKNANGESLNIINYRPCNFELNADEIKDVYAIIRSCNAMIERNCTEYKYNPLISSLMRDNNFIEYNEVENKFYLNEIAYKVIMFERKYRSYVQQLPVLVRGMMSYGYEYSSVELGEFKGCTGQDAQARAETKMEIKDLITKARMDTQSNNTIVISELLDMITEDRLYIYRDVAQGKYEVRKGGSWSEDLEKHIIIAKNVEVFEKVVPLFISMSKMFDVNDIRDIFEYCRNANGTYNFAAVRRMRTLTNIVYNGKRERLDIPIKDYVGRVYDYVDKNPTTKQMSIKKFILDSAISYAQGDSVESMNICQSQVTVERYYNKLTDLFKCLVSSSRPNKNKEVVLNKIELIWVDKEDKIAQFNEHIKFIDEFLGDIEVDGDLKDNSMKSDSTRSD